MAKRNAIPKPFVSHSPVRFGDGLRRMFLALLSVVLLAAAPAVRAADYPAKPVKIISGFSPGTSTDLIARLIASELQRNVAQPVLVETKSGAAGDIAANFVVRSDPDGYTLLASAFQLTVTPWIQKLKYDVEKDLIPVVQTAASSYVLVVNPKLPVSTFEEFVAYAKKRKGGLNFGSLGNGTGSHLGMVMLMNRAGFEAQPIPYRGSPENQQAVMSGDVDMTFDAGLNVAPNVRAGKIKAIVVIGPADPSLPGVPSINDYYPDFQLEAWHGIFAPAGTPPAIVNWLAAEISKILAQPQTRSWFLERGYRLVPSTPESFKAKVDADLARYKRVVDENRLKIE